MEIRFIKGKDLDLEKWDRAVAASAKGLPYAYSWYLDIVSKGRWDGLVEGEYERVMPLVWNAKLLGLKQLYQPVLSQQLGVFGATAEPEHYMAFLKAIPESYRYIRIQLNAELKLSEKLDGNLRSRTNLIIDLQKTYEVVRRGYSKSLRKRLKKAEGVLRIRESQDTGQVVRLYRKNLESKVQLGHRNYELIKRLLREAIRREQGELYEVRDGDGQICGTGFFMKTSKRIINVFGTSNAKGKELFAMHFLLDQVIRKHAATGLVFDFEGSEIPGVAEFFRSFGGVEEYYSVYERNRLPLWLSRILGRPVRASGST